MKRKRSPEREPDVDNANKLLKADPTTLMPIDHKINALLKQVKVTTKQKTSIDGFLKKLSDLLLSDDIEAEFKSNGIGKLKKMIPSFSCKQAFRFYKPSSIVETGSFHLGTCLKLNLKVDLSVIMPKTCLDPKDYLNQRCLYKKAVYLAHVASYLSKAKCKDVVENVKFEYERGIHVLPQLIITPAESVGHGFVICLRVQMESDSFKLSRFEVNKNNLRPKLSEQNANKDDTCPGDYSATPHYNSWVLTDLTSETHLKKLEEILSAHKSVKDAILLLKVWLHQRQLDLGFGGFSGHIMTSFVAYLMLSGRLKEFGSTYQIFENVLSELAKSNWSKSGISMVATNEDETKKRLSDFHSCFEVVFIDSSGCLNLCADMSKATFACVQHEARRAVEMMTVSEENHAEVFESLWMTPVPFARKYDEIFQINFEGHMKRCSDPKKRLRDSITDHCGNFLTAYLPTVIDILKSALGERIRLLALRPVCSASWSVGERPAFLSSSRMFGLLLDKEHCYEVDIRGPVGDSKNAYEFNRFWGSELKRFKDGVTNESISFPSNTLADQRTIVKRIVRHIMLRHSAVVADDITFSAGSLDRFLHLPTQLTKKNNIQYGTGEDEHGQIILAFDSLSAAIRSIGDLPLRISSVRGISPAFCYTEVFPPLPLTVDCFAATDGNRLVPDANEPCPPFTPAMSVVCMLERSGKWPDDKDVCDALKMSFLARLKIALDEKFEILSVFNRDSLCVFKSGYVFRLLIHFTHEITMSRLPVEKDGVVTGLKDTKETFELHKLMLVMPKLMSTLHGVHNQHPTFSCACRLAKRWLASQMLFDDFYLDEMALQIIVASLYINPAPYEAPSSPFVGFLRFLHLMATYDWAAHPLIVNFNNDLNAEDYKEIRTKFCKDRSTLPVMFLSTSLDKFSEYFTKRHPTTHILSRIATLAQESLSILQNQLDDFGQNLDAKAIFKPHTEVFDAVIHVNPEASGRSQLAVDFGSGKAFPKYSAIKPEDKIPVFDYDLILEFLQRLREQFHEFALFFYDIFGGRYIGVVWKPNAFQPLPITSACVAYRTVIVNSNEEVQLIPNVDCILKEFENWSPKLIKSVEIRRTSPAGLQATASQSQDS